MEAGSARTEAGFTFVELVVSLTVIAIGVIAAVGVMTSSFGVATATNSRSRAVAIATRELERLRAIPYAKLQVDTTTVQWSEQVEGTRFNVQRAVTWVSQSPIANAYKRGTVSVAWTDKAGSHTVDQVSLYYPGGLGPAAATTTTTPCNSTPAKPLNLTATVAPAPDGETAIDLSWQPDAASSVTVRTWSVERSTDNFATKQRITSDHPGSSTALRVDGLAVGTTYAFRVLANACGNTSLPSATATATTLASGSSNCEIGTPNVTPAQVKLTNSGNSSQLEVAPVVSVSTVGTCSSLAVTYNYQAGAPDRSQTLSGSGGIVRATLTRTGPWDVGVHALDIYSGTVKKGSILLTVCAHNASTCG